jgi:hypothetical protein
MDETNKTTAANSGKSNVEHIPAPAWHSGEPEPLEQELKAEFGLQPPTKLPEIGVVSAAQIAAWKAVNAQVYAVRALTRNADAIHVGYFKEANRATLGAAQMANKKGNPITFFEVLANQCWLGGSDALLKDDYLFMGITKELDYLYTFAASSIEKL